jgi:hypothetical protein
MGMPQYEQQVRSFSVRENTVIRRDSQFDFSDTEDKYYSVVPDDSYISSIKGGDLKENAVFSLYIYQNE